MARGARGPNWREMAGTFSWADGGSVAGGRRQAGSVVARSRAKARLNRSSQSPALGKVQGQPARRAGEPSGQGEEPPPEGLGGHDLFTQTEPGRPAGQVVRHHLDGQPGAVGGETPRGEMVQPHAVLEVADRTCSISLLPYRTSLRLADLGTKGKKVDGLASTA